MVPDIFPVTFMPPGESKNQAFEKVFNQILPKELAKVETALGNEKFLTGETLTIADFYWGNFYASWLTNSLAYEPGRRADILKKFPKYVAFGDRITAEFGDYLKSRLPRPA